MRKQILIFCILGILLILNTISYSTEGLKLNEHIEKENSIFKTNTPSKHVIVFEPPWNIYETVEEKDIDGWADAWSEGTEIDGHSGKTNLFTNAQGLGFSKIYVKLRHQKSFYPPKNTDYSFKFKFYQKGMMQFNTMWIGVGASAAYGEVGFKFYLHDGEDIIFEKYMQLKEHYVIGGAGNGDYPYSFTKEYSDSANLKAGKAYYIASYGKAKVGVDGIAFAQGSAKHYVEKAGLQRLEIEWANSPPNVPQLISPSNGAAGVSRRPTLQWSCDDPDGKYDNLEYDIYFGESVSPPLKKSGYNGNSYMPGTLSEEKKYYWKIVVKDSLGETKTSDTWSFTTEKEGVNRNFKKALPFQFTDFSAFKNILELFF